MFRFQRKTYWVDRKVQGALVARTVSYWLLCMFAVTSVLLIYRVLTGPARVFYTHFDDLWFQHSPVAITLFAILPLVIVDTIRMSNRFAGPVFRMRRVLAQLAKGETVDPIQFRQGDYWQEMAADLNKVIARLRAASPSAAPEDEAELVGAGR